MTFESMDLEEASPATVSRIGIIFMEPDFMGLKYLYQAWRKELKPTFKEEWKDEIDLLVDAFIESLLNILRTKLKEYSPTCDQNLLKSMLNILSILLKPLDDEKFLEEIVEYKQIIQRIDYAFVFAFVWGMASTVTTPNRKQFDAFFRTIVNDNKKLKKIIPSQFSEGQMYDFSYDFKSGNFKHWNLLRDEVPIPPKSQVQDIIVQTIDTIRYSEILQLLINNSIPCLFVGPTGTGKTIYIKDALYNKLDQAKHLIIDIMFSAQTSANTTQDTIDLKLNRRKKNTYGPPMGNKCIVFVDDLNMPQKEQYGAQPPIELLRQFIDHGGWYERKDKEHPFRNIIDTTLVTAMGEPGGGRTFITPRLLRHFNVIGFVNFDDLTLIKIFNKILDWYLTTYKFSSEVIGLTVKVVNSTLEVYKKISSDLLPIPVKSHYTFNLRDFAKVISGICLCTKDNVNNQDVMVRLWAHEIMRVFSDRLINDEDRLYLLITMRDIVKKIFGFSFDNVCIHLDIDKNGKVETLPEIRGLIFTDVLTPFGANTRPYEEVKEYKKLQDACENALDLYNQMSDKPMELVLFQFVIEHLIRVSRVLKLPSGNALLVGVGGSGRQSITRLASKIPDFEVKQVEIKKLYGLIEWREDLKMIFKKSGGKGEPTVFLLTDNQLKLKEFLEDINNILNTGEVPNLYNPEERTELCEMVRPAAKQEKKAPEGTPSQLFTYFIERSKKNLHIVLCFSPIGNAFRERIRNFPSLVNCCTIDWFSDWPEDGLDSVARKFLSKLDIDEKVREMCIEMCKEFHISVKESSRDFLRQLKRNYYITPSSYIELMNIFTDLLNKKRDEVKTLKDRYDYGYKCLIKTSDSVQQMEKELTELKPQLEKAQIETNEKMGIVSKQTEEADKVRNVVAGEEAVAREMQQKAAEIQADCENELSKALPILREAESALDVITTQDIAKVKKTASPHKGLLMVLSAVCHLMDESPEKKFDVNTQKQIYNYWPTAQRMMQSITFLNDLRTKWKGNMNDKKVKEMQKFTALPEFNEKDLTHISSVAAALAKYVLAVIHYYEVNLIIEPKKAALNKATEELNVVEEKLRIKQKQLKDVEDKLEILTQDLQETRDKKEDLERRYQKCTIELDRAQKLIGGLAEEKDRWLETAKKLEAIYGVLVGDVLISSGMVAYLGAFTSVFRARLSTRWVEKCQEMKIPSSLSFSIIECLGDQVKIREWLQFGLPSDNFSIENAIIQIKARRWPLAIDPQGQANKWIKSMEREHKLKIIKFSDSNYVRTLENGMEIGNPVLLENDREEVDPVLDPLLQKNIIKKQSLWVIKFADKQINYSQDFRFYITTKLRNPHYMPELTTKVTLLNFMITYEGLADQLLCKVVEIEKPELEEERDKLIIESAKNKATLKGLEDKILETIANSVEILADESAIQILQDSKSLSKEIAKKQEIAQKTEKEIEESRNAYKPVALRSSGLFFCISDLANISSMYQYSLNFFMQLFILAINQAEKSDVIETRINNLHSKFLILLYRNVCRSLFERDKLIFSCLLTIKLEELEGKLNNEEYRFLLTGGIALDEKYGPIPAEWVSEKMWGEINRLSLLNNFKGILTDFTKKIDEFKKIYDSQTPQDEIFPGKWIELSLFQKMLILRCIRPDKLLPAFQNYIKSKIGQEFIEAPAFDLSAIYDDSSNITPLIFVLSPGADPLVNLRTFATNKSKHMAIVSLGQGQGDIAESLIRDAKYKGTWVLLQNCHLAVSWLPTLEKVCDDLSSDVKNVQREFRLWLTSYPSDDFPVSILQNGIKMTNEPPRGLKTNLRKSFATDPISNDDFFNKCKKNAEFKKLLFNIIFFNAVIQERRKFGPLGWNISYDFTESDLRISVKQLRIFLDESKPGEFQQKILSYLVSEINFGGRVTDDKDRRLIMTICDDYINPKIFDDNYKYSPSGIFYAPPLSNDRQSYLDYINNLPLNPLPEIYGFHSNADITKDKGEANLLLSSILITQADTSSSKGEKSADDTIKLVVETILKDFPTLFDVKSAEGKYPVKYEESMNTVLTQELQRYNILFSEIRRSLEDLINAMQGKVLLSKDLEACSRSLFDGKVPELWKKKSYPSLKPLGSYVSDLRARFEFFRDWVENGIPAIFHINKFHFTQGFLTGALQNYARKKKIAIDEINFDFYVLEEENPPAQEDGINVVGTFIEGAKWDYTKKVLSESDPKILFVKCPLMWLKPCKTEEQHPFQYYEAPMYRTSERRGTLATTGHSTNYVMYAKLPSDLPQSHWIKRGVALLIQLDD